MHIFKVHIMEFYSFYIVITLIIFSSAFPDLSPSCPETEDGKPLLSSQSTPYGNTTAGRYTKKSAETLRECIDACCDDASCNVAFLFNTTCFSIQCHSYELCKPLKRSGKKFEKSFLVTVRLPDVKYYDELTDSDPGKSFSDILYNDEEDDDPDKDSLLPVLDNSGSTTAFFSQAPVPPRHCVYGLDNDCPDHETCLPRNKRSRTGLCYCEENYERDVTGYCKIKRSAAVGSQHITVAPSTGSAMGSPQNKTESDKSTSTTASPVHHLVVSAGDNVTLQLPENEVTLSAYALKQQGEGSDGYKYEWTLISHPEGDETGTMEDQNTKNLKLSKLRAGLYTFKVTVSSANAVGEAMVNVTVLPPERENKPPIAIIQPSNVTVKLPNKDTVLDGSFSTDDDKITKYQWEVLQVPIGYAVQLNETPTLQLKNLIPGLYRFKLTVTDSKGAFNSTFANVTVQKETDYPPTANAKSEVVIYLPQNEVTLNGNLSTDDKGIKSWEWKKSPDTDKAVDMEIIGIFVL